MANAATIIQRKFRRMKVLRYRYSKAAIQALQQILTISVVACGFYQAKGIYEMAGMSHFHDKTQTVRYMCLGANDKTYVMERIEEEENKSKDKNKDLEERGASQETPQQNKRVKKMWTISEIGDAEYTLLYANRSDSLKPPKRMWQSVDAPNPVPKLQYNYDESEECRQNAKMDAYVVCDSGVEEVHGRYVSYGLSDGVDSYQYSTTVETETKNSDGKMVTKTWDKLYQIRRIQHGPNKLWILLGVTPKGEKNMLYYVNVAQGTHDEPPMFDWVVGEKGVEPSPLLVFQSGY